MFTDTFEKVAINSGKFTKHLGVYIPKSRVTPEKLDAFAKGFKNTNIKKNLVHGALGGLVNVGADAVSSEIAHKGKPGRKSVSDRLKQYGKDFALGFVPTATGSYLGSKAFSSKALHKIKKNKEAMRSLENFKIKFNEGVAVIPKSYKPSTAIKIDRNTQKIMAQESEKQRALAGAGAIAGGIATLVAKKKRDE